MSTSAELIRQIANGDFDSNLTTLISTAVERKRYLQKQKGAENQLALKPGMRVRILPGIKPKYLIGLTGTISSLHSTRNGDLMFEFDDASYPYVAHRFQRTVGIPAALLTRIP